MLWGANRRKLKGRQSLGVKLRTPLAATQYVPLELHKKSTGKFSPSGKNPCWVVSHSKCSEHEAFGSYHLCSTYRGMWGLVVVWLSWLIGRVLAAQPRGVLIFCSKKSAPSPMLYLACLISRACQHLWWSLYSLIHKACPASCCFQ